MSGWNYEEYMNGQIRKIKKLQEKGYVAREILDRNEFSLEALRACELPLTYLVPKAEGQEMTLQEWDTHSGDKWEYDGTPFLDANLRDRIMLGLIYSSGLKRMLELLPEESKEELANLIKLDNA
jgi:hypothetical protein